MKSKKKIEQKIHILKKKNTQVEKLYESKLYEAKNYMS